MKLEITKEELYLLDGKCSTETQNIINKHKEEDRIANSLIGIPELYKPFITKFIKVAIDNGIISYKNTKLKSCDICGNRGSYVKYTRSSRYHRKGDFNYDKPIYLSGVELNRQFFNIEGYAHLGCCIECYKKIRPYLLEVIEQRDIKAEFSKVFLGKESKYKKYNKCKCTNCFWEGHEGQLGLFPCIFEGKYRGKCPFCGKENRFGKTWIEKSDEFVVVEDK